MTPLQIKQPRRSAATAVVLAASTGVVLAAYLVAVMAVAGGAEPASSAAARSAYAAAAALHNREAWDLAAEEWEAFLAAHPHDPLVPKARCYLGVCRASLDQWPAAEATFARVIRDGGDPEAVTLARWERARGTFTRARKRDDATAFLEAAECLQQFLEAAPRHPEAAAARHLLGESLWQANRRAEALDTWRRFLRDHPESPLEPDVLYALGIGEAESGAAAEATATLGRFATEHPQHPLAADVALWRADLTAAAGDAERAESMLEAVVTTHPTRAAEALERLGRLREGRGDWAGAGAAYEAIVRDHPAAPGAPAARVAAGRALIAAGRPDEARTILLSATKHGGAEAVIAAHHLARLDLDADLLDAALARVDAGLAAAAALDTAAGLAPDAVAMLHLDRAAALRRIPDRREEAVAACDTVIAARPGGPLATAAATLAAATLLDLGSADEALARAEAVLADTPDEEATRDARRDAELVRAESLAALGRTADAAEAFARFAALRPDDPRAAAAWYRLGTLRRDDGAFSAACEAFMAARAAAPAGPRAADALLAAGWCRQALGEPAAAIAAWSEVLTAYPDTPAATAARLARADASRQAGDLAAALRDVRVLMAAGSDAVDPQTRGQARLLEGLCLAGTGDDAAATTVLAALAEDQPAFSAADRVLYELAAAHGRRGAEADAEAALTALVERFSDSPLAPAAWVAIGEARRKAGDLDAATLACNRALQAITDPAGPLAERALHTLGWIEVARADHAAAVAAFARQLETVPGGPLAADAESLRGQSLLALERVAEARRAFDAALADPAAFSSPELRAATYVRAAEAAAIADDWETSLAIATRFLAAEPGSPQAPQATYAAAWALQHLGRLDEARSRYAHIAAGPPTELAARARLMEGEVLFEQGDHRGAIKAFFKVAYGFGAEASPAPFHAWQAQATFEAARCFEVLERPDQARDLYAELVARYPDAEQVPAARRRLAALGPRPAGATSR